MKRGVPNVQTNTPRFTKRCVALSRDGLVGLSLVNSVRLLAILGVDRCRRTVYIGLGRPISNCAAIFRLTAFLYELGMHLRHETFGERNPVERVCSV
jgi:hypothetical protein